MNNYENEIMNLLKGETPRQKYEYLKNILYAKTNKLNDSCNISGHDWNWKSDIQSDVCSKCGAKD